MTVTSYGRAASFAAVGPSVLTGLFSIFAGTLTAILFIPENVQDPNSLFQPAAYMTTGLLMPVILRLRRDMTSVLKIENALMVGIVYWLLLDLLQSAYPLYGVGQSHVSIAFLAIGLFASGIWLGAAGRAWPLPSAVRIAADRPLSSRMLFTAIVISFLLGMFNFALSSGFDPVVMAQGVTANRWGAPWARGQYGGFDAVLDHLQYFGYSLPALCILLARREGWLRPSVLLSIALAAIMLLFLSQAGGRRIIGVVGGAALFTWLICQQQFRLKTIIGTGIAVALLLFFLQEMLRYRNIGLGAWLAGERPELHVSYIHVDDNFLRLSQIIMIFPDLHPYVSYRPLYHALTLPIPRAIWPGKPSDPGFDLPQLIGKTGASLSSSIIGEFYASFGLAAVFLGGLIFGRLAGMWNKTLQLRGSNSNALIFGLGVMALFAGIRSYQALVQMSYMVLGWLAVSAFITNPTKTERGLRYD